MSSSDGEAVGGTLMEEILMCTVSLFPENCLSALSAVSCLVNGSQKQVDLNQNNILTAKFLKKVKLSISNSMQKYQRSNCKPHL